MAELSPTITWVPFASLARLLLALLLGLFVGLEREWRGKEAGLRTHGLSALLGAMAGMLGTPYAITCLALIGVLVVFLNLQGMRTDKGSELTSSVALLVTTLAGVLCGLGHTTRPSPSWP
jgi:MgtC family